MPTRAEEQRELELWACEVLHHDGFVSLGLEPEEREANRPKLIPPTLDLNQYEFEANAALEGGQTRYLHSKLRRFAQHVLRVIGEES